MLYNDLWDETTLPYTLNESVIAAIYKIGKGPRDYANYRPIALLNVTYKILAKVIQQRLLALIGDQLVRQQFGFRPGKNTADAIFIARRAQENAERSGTCLLMLALDYQNAFDSIPKQSLVESLHRHRTPAELTTLIMAIYDNQLVRIQMGIHTSQDYSQDTGIRQGCPLCPLPFIAVTSMMFRDIQRETPTHFFLPRGLRVPTLLYADDTLLMATRPTDLTKLLHKVEHHSQTHNLKLNRGKCKLLVTNDHGTKIYFTDGTQATRVDKLLYLGAWFHKYLDNSSILRHKLIEATGVMRQLRIFWKTMRCTIPWKLRVFEAVVRAKLFYAMETMNLTPSQQKTLDVFFYRALRRILGIPPTHIDRSWSNTRVLERACALARHPKHPRRHQGPTPFAEYDNQRRLRLLGHLLREDENHLARATVILPSGKDLAKSLPKRVGRPRTPWLEAALASAQQNLQKGSLIAEDDTLSQLQELAIAMQQPFR